MKLDRSGALVRPAGCVTAAARISLCLGVIAALAAVAAAVAFVCSA